MAYTYTQEVIVDVQFSTRRLARCYADYAYAQRQLGQEVARLYIRRVDTLYASRSGKDPASLASVHFHPLKGDRKGQFAITLTGFMRLIVTFQDKAWTVVRIEEVSKHYGD
jgi:proteic killer suppression protein